MPNWLRSLVNAFLGKVLGKTSRLARHRNPYDDRRGFQPPS